jgi:hypothetical protein
MSAAADHAKRLEGQVHTAVGDYYMMMMKRQAADKGREVSYTHAKKVPLVEWEDIKAEYVRLKQAGYDVQTRTEIHEQTERMRGAIS